MADENLNLTISASDQGASSVMQQALAIVKELDATVAKLGTTGQESGTQVAGGAAKIKTELSAVQQEALKAAQGLTAVETSSAKGASGLAIFAEHTRLASMGLSAMGLDAEAAGAKIGGLALVLDEARAALPALLAIGAGLAVFATGAQFIKGAISAAGDFDQTIAELGQTVKNQGANWEALSAETIAWANAQEKATQFSRGEALEALRNLTAAGTDLHDSMVITSVAEDAAAATGHSLTDVVHGLMEAEHGRTQILAELGIATRAQIKDGMSLQQVLDLIEQNMGGVAAAAVNTLPGAFAQLKNSFTSFEEDAGQPFQDVMVHIVQDLTAVVDYLEVNFVPQLQEAAQWMESELPTAEQAVRNLWTAFQDGYADVKAVIDFLLEHKDEVEAFFAVVIAVKAVQALADLRIAFIAAMASGGAFTTVMETMGSVVTVGLIPTIQALIASLGELVTAEAVASLGITALIAGFIYAETHWSQTVDVISGLIDKFADLVQAIGQVDEYIAKSTAVINPFAGALDAVGIAAEHAAQGMRDYAQAKRDAQNVTSSGPSADSQQMAVDEQIIASGGKKDITPETAGWTVQQAQEDLQGLEMQMHGVPQGPPTGKKPRKLDQNPQIGGKTGAGSTTPPAQVDDAFANESSATVGAADAQVKALDPLVRLKAQLTAQEEALAHAMKMTTTQSAYDAAALELKNKQIADALTYEKALNAAVASEMQSQKGAVEAVNSTKDAYENARQKYNAYEQSLDGVTKKSEAQKEEEKQLKDAVTQTQKAHENAKTALDKLDTTLGTHINQLSAARQKYTDLRDSADEVIPDLERKWSDFVDKQKQSMDEDLATARMSDAQKVAYYQQMVDSISVIDAQSLASKEQYYQKEAQAYAAMIKAEEATQKQFATDLQSQQQNEATYGLSTDQLLAYWQQKLSLDEQMQQRFFDEHGQWDAALLTQEQTAYSNLLAAQTKSYEERKQLESSFLDDILQKHESFKDAFKSLWDDIAKIYIDDLEQMIMKSSGFDKIFGALLPGGSTTAPAPGSIPGVGSSSDQLATQLTTSATDLTSSATNLSTSATNLQTAGQNFTQDANQIATSFQPPVQGLQTAGQGLQQAAQALVQAAQAIASSGSGSSGLTSLLQSGSSTSDLLAPFTGMSQSAEMNAMLGAQGYDANGVLQPYIATQQVSLDAPTIEGLTGSASGVAPSSATAAANQMTPAQLQHSFSGVLGGAMMGASVGSSIAPGNPWATGLGALGGAAGEYFGGPVGEMVGSFVGSEVGSLLGPHWKPGTYPDRDPSTSATWGQFLANFGAENAGDTSMFGETHNQISNGVSYNIDPNVAAQTGGKSEGQYIHDELSKMSPAQDQQMFGTDWQQIVAMFSQWTAQGMHNGKDGKLYIGDTSYTWQQIQQLGGEAFQDLAATGAGGGGVPVFSLTRTYPNLNISSLSSQGTFDPVTGTYTGNGVTGGRNAIAPLPYEPRQPELHFHGNMAFYGSGSKDEFLQWITQQLANRDLGAQPTGIPTYSGKKTAF